MINFRSLTLDFPTLAIEVAIKNVINNSDKVIAKIMRSIDQIIEKIVK